ncbi:hypothetical protein ABPG74_002210 [Tetrahymena malaccensis]
MSQMYQQQHQQHQQNLKQMTIAGSSAFPKAQPLSHKDIFQQFYTNYKKSYDYSYYSKQDSNEITNGNLEDNKKKLYEIWGEMHNEYLKTHPQQKNDEIISKNKIKQTDKNQKPQPKKQHQNTPNQQQKKQGDQQAQQQTAKDRLEEIQKANPVVANNLGYNQHQQQQHHIQQIQQQPLEHDKMAHQYPQYYQYHQQPAHQVIYSVPPANPIPAIQQPAYQQAHHYIPQQQTIYPQQQSYQTQYGYIPATAAPIHNPILISNPPPMNYVSPAKLDISNYISSSLQK